jgi:hypothetical protein
MEILYTWFPLSRYFAFPFGLGSENSSDGSICRYTQLSIYAFSRCLVAPFFELRLSSVQHRVFPCMRIVTILHSRLMR